jgi:hypothetical protein
LNLGHLDFDIVSTARCPAENFELRISDFASLGIFTLVESPLQIRPFMQNKANFRKSQMNVSPVITREYKNKSNWTLGENKANSNPIKANLLDAQMNISSVLTKYYRKKDDFAVQKNKPNSNPIKANTKPIKANKIPKQTQYKPNLSRRSTCCKSAEAGRSRIKPNPPSRFNNNYFHGFSLNAPDKDFNPPPNQL